MYSFICSFLLLISPMKIPVFTIIAVLLRFFAAWLKYYARNTVLLNCAATPLSAASILCARIIRASTALFMRQMRIFRFSRLFKAFYAIFFFPSAFWAFFASFAALRLFLWFSFTCRHFLLFAPDIAYFSPFLFSFSLKRQLSPALSSFKGFRGAFPAFSLSFVSWRQ